MIGGGGGGGGHLNYAVLCFTNINLNSLLTYFYDFWKESVAEKAGPIVSRFALPRFTYAPTTQTGQL